MVKLKDKGYLIVIGRNQEVMDHNVSRLYLL